MTRGLLTRISHGERSLNEEQSILGHLSQLLNTRKGEVVTSPNYGVPDFVQMMHLSSNAIFLLQKSIAETIEQHEPRLSHVSVRHIKTEDPLRLNFEITARLKSNLQSRLHFQTHMQPGGRFSVQP